MEFVIKKLGITKKEFQNIMDASTKTFYGYFSYKKIIASHPLLCGVAAIYGVSSPS